MKRLLAVTLLLLGITLGLVGSNNSMEVAYDDLPGPHATFINYY